MADIRKNLTLSAQLDDSQLRKQLEILKKELGTTFSIDAGSLNDLKSSVRDIAKEFGASLRKELEGFRGPKGKAAAAQAQGQKDSSASDIGSFQVRQMQVTNMIVNTMTIKGISRSSGIGLGPQAGAPGPEEGEEENRKGILDMIPGARRLQKRFGTVGLASAGLTAAGIAVSKGVDEVTDFRRLMIQRQQAETLDVMRGRALEGAVRQSGRGLNFTSAGHATGGILAGAGAGAAGGAAIGAGLGALGFGALAVPGALVGGAVGGIYGGVRGYFSGGEKEAETRAMNARPALEALDYTRSLRQSRIQAFAGGGIKPNQLTLMQQAGAEQFGFMPEETVNQFTQARQFLGNRAAQGNLQQLQKLQRDVGLDVGEGARSAEVFAGAGRTTMAGGVQKMVDTLKKGVSAGVKDAKLPEFLKTTTDLIQSQTGFAKLDTDKIAKEMATSAAQFARGGEVTQTNLEQAKAMQETMRGLSGTTEGLAGAMNITGATKAAREAGIDLDSLQTIALAQASTQGEESIRQVLQETGASKDQIEKATQGILKGKENLPERATEMLFGNEQAGQLSRQAFVGSQLGLGRFTEDRAGFFQAREFKPTEREGKLPEVSKTPELDSLIKEAATKQTMFVAGVDLMARESNKVAEQLKTAATEIKKAADYIKDVIGPANVQVKR